MSSLSSFYARVYPWTPVGDEGDASRPGFYAECRQPCREAWQRRDTAEQAAADAKGHNDRLHLGAAVILDYGIAPS